MANGNFAPAYKAIRSDRYLYVLYSNGQSELYDMLRDPAQLRNVAGDRRYKRVRKFMRVHLAGFTGCAGFTCRVEIGAEPRPLKRKAKPKKPKVPKGDGKGGKPVKPEKPAKP